MAASDDREDFGLTRRRGEQALRRVQRVGPFAKRWQSSETPPHCHYLHTKTAIIDNNWATVGSANLDDASQDFVEFARPALSGKPRNSETNIVVFEDHAPQRSAVDALRRRVWAEHLGFVDVQGRLNPDDPALAAPPSGKSWLDIWGQKADEKLSGLKNNPSQVTSSQVLRWPSPHFAGSHKDHKDSKAYLRLLFNADDKLNNFDVIGSPPSIPFAYPV